MDSTKVITGKVRFCYCDVFEAKAMNEGETPKYSVCVLIPKTDTTTLNKINKAILNEFSKLKIQRNNKR